jgi:hypothetical protein
MIDYLEIGVAQGDHAEKLMVDEHIRYVGVDKWEWDTTLENEKNKLANWDSQDKWDEVYQKVLERLEPYGNRAKIIRGCTRNVLPTLNKKFDVIYVDGDHSYEGAKKDLELSLPLLKNWASKMIVDDLHYTEVKKAFNEFVKENEVEYKGNTIWLR